MSSIFSTPSLSSLSLSDIQSAGRRHGLVIDVPRTYGKGMYRVANAWAIVYLHIDARGITVNRYYGNRWRVTYKGKVLETAMRKAAEWLPLSPLY